MAAREIPDIVVIGCGPAGLTAAITLANAGIATVLAGLTPPQSDNRTTALLASSVTALETLGVWQHCAQAAAPLRVMRIVDDTGRLLRAPEIRFEAGEIGLDSFGHNIENRQLLGALITRAQELPTLKLIDARVQSVETGASGVDVYLANGRAIHARMTIGADGRQSLCRAAAKIAVERRDYPQSALTLTLWHSRPHHDISTEFHTASGPFTLVPLRGNRASLVWVLDPQTAAEMAALDDAALADAIERRSHAILGKLAVEEGRGMFPLTLQQAKQFATRRIALIGEAAHVLPPIGAQGLNLGLRDAAAIGELVIDAVRSGGDPGSDALLGQYDRARRADVGSRALAVDFLNRSLLSDFLPVQGARIFGLYLIDRLGPLRRALMREGVAPTGAQPKLMRGEAL